MKAYQSTISKVCQHHNCEEKATTIVSYDKVQYVGGDDCSTVGHRCMCSKHANELYERMCDNE